VSEIDNNYKKIIKRVLGFGVRRPNRTGVDTVAISSAIFEHDMADGFPILHNKKISFKTSKVELIGFLLGITDKRWYQDRGCTIWDEWCNPDHVAHLTGDEKLAAMKNCRDLGPIYGSQWRIFNSSEEESADQIQMMLHSLEKSPDSRRMIVNAWNPLDLHSMALPPCHFSFQVLVINGKLHLNWNQRSVDVFLGLPYNICFYGMLLECLAKQFGYEPGVLTGFLGDTHIYVNHLEQVEEYMGREDPIECNPYLIIPSNLPSEFSILDEAAMMKLKITGYNPLPAIRAEVAV
jgi:thymidylate synthase